MNPQPAMTPREFVEKWQYASNLKARSAAQEHFIDLCRMLGHPKPAELGSLCRELQEGKGAVGKQVSGSTAPLAGQATIKPVRHTSADVKVETWSTE